MKLQRRAPKKKALRTQAVKLDLQEKQATREHCARMFRQWVIAGMIAAGLAFMAVGIPGGESVAIAGGSLLVGHSLSSEFSGGR
jgi:hypothetical protein